MSEFIRIRGQSGIGDGIYLRSIVWHFVDNGQKMEVCTKWPDLYRQFPEGTVRTDSFTKSDRIQLHCSYSMRKSDQTTNQFRDCCIQVGIRNPIKQVLRWNPERTELIDKIREMADGKKIVLALMPRRPMGRDDYMELAPDYRKLNQMCGVLREQGLFLVQIGENRKDSERKGLPMISEFDIDLVDKISITDLLDISTITDGFIGQVSLIVPLAQANHKPGMFLFAKNGLKSKNPFIRLITPAKICEPMDSHVVDDDPAFLVKTETWAKKI